MIMESTNETVRFHCKGYGYLLLYSLLVMTLGFMETFHSALFVELEHQLDADTALISSMITAKSISFGISGVICALILDSYHETHRFIAIITMLSAISIAVIPWIQNTIPMFMLFIVIGSSVGTAFVSFPVYIYRAYPDSQSRMMYIAMTIYGISKTVLPLMIQLSITLTASYQYTLYFVTLVATVTAVILVIAPTPKHDAERTLKRQLSNSSVVEGEGRTENVNSIDVASFADALNADNQHVTTQRVLIVLLMLTMGSFSATQSGLVNFIALYCDQYLIDNDNDSASTSNQSTGRLMISGYYGGQLMYRLMVAMMVGERLKSIWTPTRTLTAGFIGMNVYLILWVSMKENVALLLVVYIGCGFISSGIFPDIFKWCELMTPVSGILSCWFIGGFASGDALIVFVIGEMISNGLTVDKLPIPILVCSAFGTLLILGNIALYRVYSVHKEAVIEKVQHENKEKIGKVDSDSVNVEDIYVDGDLSTKMS